MKEGPDIALLGSLIGEPARANILTALMSGKALTATELAAEAGVTLPTASSHLARLEGAALIRQNRQGRHRYFALADPDVGLVLEAMMGLAAKRGLLRTRTGPRDAEMRKARVCYDHLAGDMGVMLFDCLVASGHLEVSGDDVQLTVTGGRFFGDFGIDVGPLARGRRPLCRSCLDWSARRSHLSGALGTAVLRQVQDLGWASRRDGTRVVVFTRAGEKAFVDTFGTGRGAN